MQVYGYKKCLTAIVIRKMQITTVRYYGQAKIINLTIIGLDEDMGDSVYMVIPNNAGGSNTWYKHIGVHFDDI